MRLLCLLVLLCGCASATCQSTFDARNQSQISWCVNSNGEIEQFGIPGNFSQIISEGYALCSTAGQEYWSVGGQDSGNWKAPVITQPHGPNTTPLTITRTSLDGQVTLIQTFSWLNSHKILGIKMRAQPGQGQLIRYAELDPSQSLSDRTMTSAFAWGHASIGTFMRPNPPMSTSYATNGGIKNLCSGTPTNGNQALKLSWFVAGQKWTPYFEYSAIR